ncbi:DNA-binding response regulator, NarL/FixJ family, contains REC and HTH domains [Goodfellowiella coeruleoviolacea]|uniref:DNA-binding response regulator, NarL/FixJ family, contains REC and HTH domains n=2 Tax=Goodfellowiella coeruleoviolacea TaxID=334858 RepID=A0AAE3GD95_9PSEU|nr:response regulator transcription factor [Goodfellowiella coeruleoviolacea]MCP2165249.1 DNA-binding response regulator, NarL/FixJ family, contains REC and HTH domains [Goodfellowiella coeruleoviolacea]
MTIRVLLADDHAMFRSGMRAVLDTQADLECVAEVADGRAAITEIHRLRPDVAVLDVRMPRLDGIAATEAVLAAPGNGTRVLVLTTYDSDEYVYRALRAGASGFLLKSLPPEELISAVRVAARGDALIDPSVTRRLVEQFTTSIEPPSRTPEVDRLTAREREVLLLVADARSNAEIARELGVGEETVKTHVSRVLAKLGLRDRVHAVVYAHRNGLVGR